MNFVDRVIKECVEARIEAQRHGVANYGVYVTCTNEHGDAMHQVFGTVDDSGSIMLPWPENAPPTLPEVRTEEVEGMGLDLKLLPVCGKDLDYSHVVLDMVRCKELFEALMQLPSRDILPTFDTFLCRDGEYEEEHYGNTQEDAYGERLQMVAVRELLRFVDHPGVYEEPQNRAVWAYLRELPEESMIALYWD